MYYNCFINEKYRKVAVFYMPKFLEAVKLSNNVSKALKFFNFEATSFPGKVVQKIYPDFLSKCNEYVNHPCLNAPHNRFDNGCCKIWPHLLQSIVLLPVLYDPFYQKI